MSEENDEGEYKHIDTEISKRPKNEGASVPILKGKNGTNGDGTGQTGTNGDKCAPVKNWDEEYREIARMARLAKTNAEILFAEHGGKYYVASESLHRDMAHLKKWLKITNIMIFLIILALIGYSIVKWDVIKGYLNYDVLSLLTQ